jgi:hypothetical protein
MKKNLICALFVATFVIPQVTFASWWNPFTWNIFSKKVEIKIEQITSTSSVQNISIKATSTIKTTAVQIKTKKDDVAKITKPIVVTSVKEDVIETQQSNQEPLYITVLKTFLASPNLESYKSLCLKASDVNIPNQYKEILNSERTQITKVPVNLYDAMNCDSMNATKYNYVVSITKPGFLKWEFDNSDSDSLRAKKIKYNNQIEKINSTYHFVMYEQYPINFINGSGAFELTHKFNYHLSIYIPEENANNLLSDSSGNSRYTFSF